MRRKIHSLTFVFMALLMMLMTFASCSKIQDLLNEGDDDDDDDGGINPPELVEGSKCPERPLGGEIQQGGLF